jgi:competence protein ComEA
MNQISNSWDRINKMGLVYWREITLGLLALVGVGVGLFWWKTTQVDQDRFEIVSSDSVLGTNVSSATVTVDVSGEVVNPGVYTLASNLRVDDALASAGGMTTKSNTNWIASNLNRAEHLRDGMKIYIPAIAENEANTVNNITANDKINLNIATTSELEELPGIGPATAQKIISNRPYTTVEELKSKKIIGAKVFDQIKDSVVAW